MSYYLDCSSSTSEHGVLHECEICCRRHNSKPCTLHSKVPSCISPFGLFCLLEMGVCGCLYEYFIWRRTSRTCAYYNLGLSSRRHVNITNSVRHLYVFEASSCLSVPHASDETLGIARLVWWSHTPCRRSQHFSLQATTGGLQAIFKAHRAARVAI